MFRTHMVGLLSLAFPFPAFLFCSRRDWLPGRTGLRENPVAYTVRGVFRSAEMKRDKLTCCLGNAERWAQPSGARKPSRGDADSSSDRATIEGTLDDPSHRKPKELFRERDCLGTNNAER
ncbi:hypothetical protein SKAU_G00076240 [Synaphobranchus kaupii]|uniref:Secreted protein n=1 Tax=Synaphobranchus kaupii TaxID=118154 RepID=A0A9Q1G7R1_SYNKA|nr:hypothetical protein SKAU_G00076240 [Synaphobranchus kaupii]